MVKSHVLGMGRIRGKGGSTPSTSFQTCTSATPRAAPSTVAVKSLPPLPSVVMAPAPAHPLPPSMQHVKAWTYQKHVKVNVYQ